MKVRCAFDEMLQIDLLIAHPDNHNIHTEEQIERLAKMLKYQGWRSPIEISKQSGYITAGHARWLAAKKNNWDKVPVNHQDYDSVQQEYAHVQGDNAIASWATLDLGAINQDIQDFDPSFDVDMMGIEDFEMEPADKYSGGASEEKEETEICRECGQKIK